MANARRGEVEATLDGQNFCLCLTLGALAELESAFGASDLVSLAERFDQRRLSSRDLLRIIACGLRGGGHAASDEEVGRMKVDGGLAEYARIAAALIAATFGEGEAANP
ncbi:MULTISPECIES: gene transfer agent family protein [Methylosinus]|uniref:Gene transfer agent family protein n=1 Tax=Methylosinus trichosporium (strain ATCC 35070 / NCIMB 11131 / UNIQEM 75 / OB3b) TaxID=595536 RepID=A0A2D2CWV7_METT3|nr:MULTISPECIES: gene transfer agent family protein [Methylosinus]ATQ67149.1 gene transfer agent family protein [Methylosinus trichosporium OB3b]OBS52701.1 transfer Agent [Methylosinus sp. 3S-1]